MQFGDYIRSKLWEKSVSLSDLSIKIGVKSRSTLYRMFEGRCSYNKAAELFYKIIKVVDFSEAEKNHCVQLMEELKTDRFYIETRKILSNIYKSKINEGFICEKSILSDELVKNCNGGG